jgi:hypothetical protein
MAKIPKDEIAGYECRFAVHIPPPPGEHNDYHLIKEVIHLKDGSRVPNIRIKENFKRSFYVTKKGFQNHKSKKEWEDIDKLNKFECTQSELQFAVAKALGATGKMDKWVPTPMQVGKKGSRSPYLYGSDILSTAIIKRQYAEAFPTLNTPYSVACFDTETDMENGTGEIIMATLSFGSKVVTAVRRDFLNGVANAEERAREMFQRYLGNITDSDGNVTNLVESRKIDWELKIVDTEIEIITTCFKRAHEWKPDFVAIFNIDFDVPKMLDACKRAGVDPKDIFCDPCIPKAYRFFNYVQGPRQKKTAKGDITPLKPHEQWHTVFCPASFYFIDAMCVYKKIRNAEQEEPSYSLDALLNKHLGLRKLNFTVADGFVKADWHIFMQTQYKLEYVIYNVFDCVSMELLDEKTKDLSIAMPMQSGSSDFCNFKSQPRRTVDNLHFVCLMRDKVIGSTSDEMSDGFDGLTLGLDDWIVTLPAHLVMDNGLCIIEEYPAMRTNCRAHIGDLDVSASYPNGECVFNVSKETTHTELCSIEGVDEELQRLEGVNLSAGPTNALEICHHLMGMPTLDELLESFEDAA